MPEKEFHEAAVQELDLGSGVTIAYRRLDKAGGPPVLMLHGWPLSGATFRFVAGLLSEHFTCYVPDLPGGGDTKWSDKTDFKWKGQAETVRQLANRLGLERYYLVGQDSGAMIARSLALVDGKRIAKLAMTNTEIPHVHPLSWKFIRWFTCRGELAHWSFRRGFRWRWLMRTRFAFGDSFYDRRLVDGEFRELFLRPLFESRHRMEGHFRFIQGWRWEYLDEMERLHGQIRMPTLLIWGEDDPILKVERAEQMAKQFPDARLERVKRAKLFVQEERPAEVAKLLLDFFAEAKRDETSV
jgi:pimeloyl-ACP methyl ester carboxylesterase